MPRLTVDGPVVRDDAVIHDSEYRALLAEADSTFLPDIEDHIGRFGARDPS